MNIFGKITATALGTLCATAAMAADYKVIRTLELSSPATEAWHVIGDFCDIDDWHPDVSACALKVRDGALVRVVTTNAGDEFVHKRLAQEPGMSYTYKLVSTSLPIEKYTATLSVERFGTPSIAWSANFSSDDPAMEQVIVDQIEAGMEAIKAKLGAH